MSKKAKRILALLNDPRSRDRLLDRLNRENTPEGAPVNGGGKEMSILKEMNEFDADHEKFMDSLKGAVDG